MNKESKIAILSYGVEGKSTLNFLMAHGYKNLNILDENKSLQILSEHKNIPVISGKNIWGKMDAFDYIFRSPGISPLKIQEKTKDLKQQPILTSATEYFLEYCENKNIKNIIGVTGTKGKGTTSSLITEIIKNAGLKVHIGGNIGIPALDFLDDIQEDDFVVLELSSFQTFSFTKSPHIAVILMVTQEHLDYHKDIQEYQDAKAQMVKNQTVNDFIIYHEDFKGSCDIAKKSQAIKIPFSPTSQNSDFYIKDKYIYHKQEKILDVKNIKLIGKHNWNNVLAALNAVACLHEKKIRSEVIQETLKTFVGLPLRIEKIAIKNNITFINDSFSTVPETSIAAIQSFPNQNIAIMLGGSDKGSDYTELAKVIKNNPQVFAVCYGQMGKTIQEKIQSPGPHPNPLPKGEGVEQTVVVESFEEAFKEATTHLETLQEGVCILSPACASFDLFTSYKKRGERFNELVMSYRA